MQPFAQVTADVKPQCSMAQWGQGLGVKVIAFAVQPCSLEESLASHDYSKCKHAQVSNKFSARK